MSPMYCNENLTGCSPLIQAVYVREAVMDHFEQSEWTGQFQDKTLGNSVNPEHFVKLMKIATKCTCDRMKGRPSSEKVSFIT